MKWTYHAATINSLAFYKAEEDFVQYMIVEAYPDTLYVYYRNTGESICIPL
jgi:NADPH-dependent curcumin reductase CurA